LSFDLFFSIFTTLSSSDLDDLLIKYKVNRFSLILSLLRTSITSDGDDENFLFQSSIYFLSSLRVDLLLIMSPRSKTSLSVKVKTNDLNSSMVISYGKVCFCSEPKTLMVNSSPPLLLNLCTSVLFIF